MQLHVKTIFAAGQLELVSQVIGGRLEPNHKDQQVCWDLDPDA